MCFNQFQVSSIRFRCLQSVSGVSNDHVSVVSSTVAADRRQLVYVTAIVVDAAGVTVPTASGLPSEYQYNLPVDNIAFSVVASPAGAGHLYAVGARDPVDANQMAGASLRALLNQRQRRQSRNNIASFIYQYIIVVFY
jgi:hypothetical protein